ncbi:MAG: hypothetical protein J5908_12780 [Selenomonas sp.]|nr:hypothetical protein [Selenomonas sp.]
MTKPNSQKDYTSFEGSYQVFLPFNLEFQIGKDDLVRLLRHCIGGMDITGDGALAFSLFLMRKRESERE